VVKRIYLLITILVCLDLCSVGTCQAENADVINHQDAASAQKIFRVGETDIIIPPPTHEMVNMDSESLDFLRELSLTKSRLIAGFVLQNERSLQADESELPYTKHAVVTVPKSKEFGVFNASDFKEAILGVSKGFDELDPLAEDAEDVWNHRMEVLDIQDAVLNIHSPIKLGRMFSRPNAYGYGIIVPMEINGEDSLVAMGTIMVLVKNKIILFYLYDDYKNTETANWLKNTSSQWVDAILDANNTQAEDIEVSADSGDELSVADRRLSEPASHAAPLVLADEMPASGGEFQESQDDEVSAITDEVFETIADELLASGGESQESQDDEVPAISGEAPAIITDEYPVISGDSNSLADSEITVVPGDVPVIPGSTDNEYLQLRSAINRDRQNLGLVKAFKKHAKKLLVKWQDEAPDDIAKKIKSLGTFRELEATHLRINVINSLSDHGEHGRGAALKLVGLLGSSAGLHPPELFFWRPITEERTQAANALIGMEEAGVIALIYACSLDSDDIYADDQAEQHKLLNTIVTASEALQLVFAVKHNKPTIDWIKLFLDKSYDDDSDRSDDPKLVDTTKASWRDNEFLMTLLVVLGLFVVARVMR
jgi:hypothetical protein